MHVLLARVGPPTGPDERKVSCRQADLVVVVAGVRPLVKEGDLVLVDVSGVPFRVVARVERRAWPPELPTSIEELRRIRGARARKHLGGLLVTTGLYGVDPEGQPYEAGYGRPGGPWAVINYSGWRLSDLANDVIDVFPCTVEGREIWVIPRNAGPEPPTGERPPESPRPPVAPGATDTRVLSTRTPPPPADEPLDRTFRFLDLTFADGSVQLPFRERPLTVATPLARALYNDVRRELDAALPDGVRAVGARRWDGHITCVLHGLDGLAAIFDGVRRTRLIRAVLDEPGWRDAAALAASLSDSGRPDPGDLLDVRELDVARRAEAFRRLFAARALGERVLVLRGRAVIVPLAAGDGGTPWLAWEDTSGDYATYLFRPTCDAQREEMLAWTADPASRRTELLSDPVLKKRLGYVQKVVHKDASGEALAGWWTRLLRVIHSGSGG